MDLVAIQKQMRVSFLVEAADLLVELDSSLLELESQPDNADLLNRVFRAIHTIKGSGATAGFKEMAAFTHHVEELFDEARVGHLHLTSEMIDLALAACDLIGTLLKTDAPASHAEQCNDIIARLAKHLPHGTAAAAEASTAKAEEVAGAQIYQIHFKPNESVFFSGTDPLSLLEELGDLGSCEVKADFSELPPLDGLNPEQCYIAWDIQLISDHPISKVKEVFMFVEDESEIRIDHKSLKENEACEEKGDESFRIFMDGVDQCIGALNVFVPQIQAPGVAAEGVLKNCLRTMRILVTASLTQDCTELKVIAESQILLLEPAVTSAEAMTEGFKQELADNQKKLVALQQELRKRTASPVPSASNEPAVEPRKSEGADTATTNSIRVDQDKLDRLMRVVGELLIARNAFPIIAHKVSVEHQLTGLGNELKQAGNSISHIADELQATVMAIRMMPVRSVFQRFPRMVRDMSRALGKDVDLKIEGEDTELDKTVIERIGDPLVHLVRNSVDHGLELPDERESQGKPRMGTVNLRAFNQGGLVIIEVRDDGKGMDPAKLKRHAVKKGVITEEYAATLSEQQALELIFMPGFSTADKVTDISGRGVGMDVVRNNIRQLKGTVTLQSVMGHGSKVTIELPTSLMVSRGILVNDANEEYILPMENVLELVKLPKQRIHRHAGSCFAQIRNDVYPVMRLSERLGASSSGEDEEVVSVVLLQLERSRVGVAVDRFLSEVEVIVKPLTGDFERVREFQGATIMGDGRVVLVINPNTLFKN